MILFSEKLRFQFRQVFWGEYPREDCVPAILGLLRKRNAVQASTNDKDCSFLRCTLDSVQPEFLPDPVLNWGIADRLYWVAVFVVAANLHPVSKLSVDPRLYPIFK